MQIQMRNQFLKCVHFHPQIPVHLIMLAQVLGHRHLEPVETLEQEAGSGLAQPQGACWDTCLATATVATTTTTNNRMAVIANPDRASGVGGPLVTPLVPVITHQRLVVDRQEVPEPEPLQVLVEPQEDKYSVVEVLFCISRIDLIFHNKKITSNMHSLSIDSLKIGLPFC